MGSSPAYSARKALEQRLRADMLDHYADRPVEAPSRPDEVAAAVEQDRLRRQAEALRERDRLAAQLGPLVERRRLDLAVLAEAMLSSPVFDCRDPGGAMDLERLGRLLDAFDPPPSPRPLPSGDRSSPSRGFGGPSYVYGRRPRGVG